MEAIDNVLGLANAILWHNYALFAVIGVGVLFTAWSGFSQWRSLTHGWHVIRGRYDEASDPGAINHFQALSAALSATVGLGNIGGVALAVALGGPGAVFWMWVVGLLGMAIKLTEVTLSMLYRNTSDPDNPHGGPMWVIKKGIARSYPNAGMLASVLGGIFCVTLLVSTVTGGNMFQAWNVGEITASYFGVPSIVTGIVMAVLVGMVIIGGIKRIGAVAGRLVPIMCALYLLAGAYVLVVNAASLPEIFALIFRSAFAPSEATGAFLGGTAAYAFLFGMKRALFSNEAGQGSSPIAHSAAKTREPVREGVVAGLEPFVDTLVVCSFTALVILSSGIWNRPADGVYAEAPALVEVSPGQWSLPRQAAPPIVRDGESWVANQAVYAVVKGDQNESTGNTLNRLDGTVVVENNTPIIEWGTVSSTMQPLLQDGGVYFVFAGATLTAKAFDTVTNGLGKYLVTMAAWLFAISTMISWSYYGEQGMVYLFGERSVLPYKIIYCVLIIVATAGLIKTDAQLDNLTGLGTGLMLFANVPIMLFFGHHAMRAYKDYIRRLRSGRMGPGHPAPNIEDVISGRDVR